MQEKSFKPSWTRNKQCGENGLNHRGLNKLSNLIRFRENNANDFSRWKNYKKSWFSFCLAVVLCLWALTACTGASNVTNPAGQGKPVQESTALSGQPVSKPAESTADKTAKENNGAKEKTAENTESVKPEKPADTYHEWSFLAVGDIMVHKEQLKRAYQPASDSFDFTESFVYAKPFIESANYAFANLETTLAGRSTNTKSESGSMYRGYSGYPNFNAPESLADALKAAGFDFLGTANNHSLDKGLNGVINTLAYLRQIDMPHTGTFDTTEERDTLKVVESGGLKIGVIAYTYATNGISLKAEDMYRINTLDNYQAGQIEQLYETVRKAKEQPIDLLFVMMHYGNEYWEKPEKTYQAGITQKLIELGVDMVIGSHPHTLQPLIYTENDAILLKKSETEQTPVPAANQSKNSLESSAETTAKIVMTNGMENTAASALKNSGENTAENQTESIVNTSNAADAMAAGDEKNKTALKTGESMTAAEQATSTDSSQSGEELPWQVAGIYSLGNFISSQRVVSEYKTDTDTGAMMKWVYQWKNKEKPVLVKIGILPTIVVWQDDRATVLPINEISIAAAKADPTMKITAYVEGRIENAKNTVLKRLTAFFPDSLIQSMRTEGDGFTYLYLHPEIKAGQ